MIARLSAVTPYLLQFLQDHEQKGALTFLDEDDTSTEDNETVIKLLNAANHHRLKPEDWYTNALLEKYKDADPRLSAKIGLELWELYRNVKATLHSKEAPLLVSVDVETRSSKPGTIGRDSGYESMQTSLAATLMQPMHQPTTKELDLIEVASDFSSNSIRLDDRLSVPSPPQGVELGRDTEFQCQFCLKKVQNIDNLKKWR